MGVLKIALTQLIGLHSEGWDGEVRKIFSSGKSINQSILDYAEPQGFCLRFIDPYGDTIFNGLQVPELIKELSTMKEKVKDTSVLRDIDHMIEFLQLEGDEGHAYFRFVGD